MQVLLPSERGPEGLCRFPTQPWCGRCPRRLARVFANRAGAHRASGPILLAAVILAWFMDFVMVAKVAMVAVFPNVASVGIKECVVATTVGELDACIGSLGHDALGLENWS